MDILLTLALWLHLAALGIGGAATFGVPVLGMVADGASADGRVALGLAMQRLAFLGRFAMGLLIVTGLFMVGASYGLSGLSAWFWIKMVLVAGFVTLIVTSTRNGRRARAGDSAALARAPLLGVIGVLFFLAIVLSAVMTFL